MHRPYGDSRGSTADDYVLAVTLFMHTIVRPVGRRGRKRTAPLANSPVACLSRPSPRRRAPPSPRAGRPRCQGSFARPTGECPSGQRERSVKPSAQPTQVRILPPPYSTGHCFGGPLLHLLGRHVLDVR